MVEDEESLRVPVAKLLRRRGFAVIEASDGRSGMDLFREQVGKIDVVLLDMTLPGASGADVMANMSIVRPDIKVILTSAFDLETVREALHGQDPTAYIRKPYSSAQLAELLRATCLGKSRAQSA